MSIQPIVFNIRYTPYQLPKSATLTQINNHSQERAFYSMTDKYNIYSYMVDKEKHKPPDDLDAQIEDAKLKEANVQNRAVQEVKQKYNILNYLEKSIKVFNDKGYISDKELKAMKERAKNNKGNIWHGFISMNEEESPKIDTPEKCMELLKRTFPSFLKDAGFNVNNMDLMCCLHTDKPHHLHLHFVFWEKEPKCKSKTKNSEFEYRRKGKICKRPAIDNFLIRVGLFLDEGKEDIYMTRDAAYKTIRKLLNTKVSKRKSYKDILNDILQLTDDLPSTGRLSYASKDMEPFRERIDHIVDDIISSDNKATKADKAFYQALDERREKITNICGNHKFAVDNGTDDRRQGTDKFLPVYNFKMDDGKVSMCDDLEDDYRRRLGNLVLKFCKDVRTKRYDPSVRRRKEVNDRKLKRDLAATSKDVNSLFKTLLKMIVNECAATSGKPFNRLRQIEEEIQQEQNQSKEDKNRN